jgi:hypothetical protein
MPSRAFANSTGPAGQYLHASPFSNSLATYTLTSWIYPTAVPDFPSGSFFPVLWKGSVQTDVQEFQGPSMSVYSDANGVLQLWFAQTHATQDASVFTLLTGELKLNTWSNISFVVNADSAGSAQAFINGVEVVYDGTLSHPYIGAAFDDSPFDWTVSVDVPGVNKSVSFVGDISDTRIYTRALSSAELLQLAAFQEPSASGLVARWKMCGNSPEVDSAGGHSMVVHLASVSPNQPFAFCGSTPYSVPDDRTYNVFPNNAENNQGTLIYDAPAHPSTPATVDSRVDKPTDSRVAANIPQNSRTPGTYGPGN